jgi:hypothetical protein
MSSSPFEPPDPIPSDPRELHAKLPVWARTLIDDLRRAAESWKRYAIAARLEGDPNSPVVLYHYSDIPVGLPVRESIFFCDPQRTNRRTGRPEAVMSCRFMPDTGVLIVDALAGEPIMVVPSASNLVRLASMPTDTRRTVWG